MANWSLPVLTSLYTDVMTLLKARDVDALTSCLNTPTNPPTGAFQYIRATNQFREFNGTTWDDKVLSVAGGGTGGANAADARAALGIGTLGVQGSGTVAITGGTITGVSLDASGFTTGTVALARGGTGASLALGATGTILRSNGSALEFSTVGTALTALNASNLDSGTVPTARLAGITTSQMASAVVSQFTNDAGYVTSATASLPIGALVDYAGADAPSGWLYCQGQAVSRSTYAALFSVLGTVFGAGDGSTTFNVPNFQNRSALGIGAYGAGTAIGSLNHAHSAGTLANDTSATHSHSISGTTAAGTSHTHGSFTGTSGAGSSHGHASGGNTGATEPPNHGHGFTTSTEVVGSTGVTINEGDGNFGNELVLKSITGGSHGHTGTTGGVVSGISHVHTTPATGSESSHTHTGGTFAVGAEALHTHTGGSLAAAAGGAHSHTISGATAVGNHSCLVINKIIKYM